MKFSFDFVLDPDPCPWLICQHAVVIIAWEGGSANTLCASYLRCADHTIAGGQCKICSHPRYKPTLWHASPLSWQETS